MPTSMASQVRRPRVVKPKQRPSLLDWQLRGDIWVLRRGPKLYCLCVNNYPLAYLAATRLDLPTLNQLVWNLRHRWPRPTP